MIFTFCCFNVCYHSLSNHQIHFHFLIYAIYQYSTNIKYFHFPTDISFHFHFLHDSHYLHFQDPPVTGLTYDRGLCQRLLVNTKTNSPKHFCQTVNRQLSTVNSQLSNCQNGNGSLPFHCLLLSYIFNCKINPAVC